MTKKIPTVVAQNSARINMFISIVLFSLLTRIALPPFFGHLPNFSALDAIALFCGAYFCSRFTACAIVLLTVWLGDVLLSKLVMGHWTLFYAGFYWQYASYCCITLIGTTLTIRHRNINLLRLVPVCALSATLFFVISNFGVWASGMLYPLTWDGLIACYIAAVPFFKNTLMSDLFFSVVLFGIYNILQKTRYALFTHHLSSN